MVTVLCLLLFETVAPIERDFVRPMCVEAQERSYLVHLPCGYDPTTPIPVVLAFHGAGTNARMMMKMSGLNEAADRAGFVVVYPNGSGIGMFRSFTAGGLAPRMAARKPDDVRFVKAILDDLPRVVNVDRRRIYATGFSNGGMMCYRLAAEMADRIAAIAPVAGTMATGCAAPARPVPILHFHGTADRIVPPTGPDWKTPRFLTFQSLAETIRIWTALNGCDNHVREEQLADTCRDGTRVVRKTHLPTGNGAEVTLIEVVGGGHTWPGRAAPFRFLGPASKDISANDLMWEFFCRHSLP